MIRLAFDIRNLRQCRIARTTSPANPAVGSFILLYAADAQHFGLIFAYSTEISSVSGQVIFGLTDPQGRFVAISQIVSIAAAAQETSPPAGPLMVLVPPGWSFQAFVATSSGAGQTITCQAMILELMLTGGTADIERADAGL